MAVNGLSNELGNAKSYGFFDVRFKIQGGGSFRAFSEAYGRYALRRIRNASTLSGCPN